MGSPLIFYSLIFLFQSITFTSSSMIPIYPSSTRWRNSPITTIRQINNGGLMSPYAQSHPGQFLQISRRHGQLGRLNSPEIPLNPASSLENSAIFYIRLPPRPFVLVPGLGYVSPPHQYHSPVLSLSTDSGINFAPALNEGLGGIRGPMTSGMEDSNSIETQKNEAIISLPLQFLSNGRPSQIDKPHPTKVSTSIIESSKPQLITSGGTYSFNGRPNGVFIVRSPTDLVI